MVCARITGGPINWAEVIDEGANRPVTGGVAAWTGGEKGGVGYREAGLGANGSDMGRYCSRADMRGQNSRRLLAVSTVVEVYATKMRGWECGRGVG